MIELRTGQPGAGKTLFALSDVRARAEKEKRQVYYSGIADLMIPGWIEIEDATKWPELPDGSIVVIDECQRVFRPRHTGSSVPAHVAQLETHRHRGFDVVLVTQHPKLVDTNIRRLVGRHLHVMRAFGAKAAVVHEWQEVCPDPDLSRADSISTTRPYPKEVFAWYKSAELHTHKARIPFRVWLLFASPIFVLALGLCIWRWISAKTGADAGSKSVPVGLHTASGAGSSALSTPQYLAAYTPRLAGFPHTASVYDDVTKPVTAPFPAACVSSSAKCTCYTQQGTRLDTSVDLCRSIVERGFFKDWKDEDRGPGSGGGHNPQAGRRDQLPNDQPRSSGVSGSLDPASTFSQDLMQSNRGDSSSRSSPLPGSGADSRTAKP